MDQEQMNQYERTQRVSELDLLRERVERLERKVNHLVERWGETNRRIDSLLAKLKFIGDPT